MKMIFLVLGVLSLALFLWRLRKEPRSFLNVVLLLVTAVLLFCAFAVLTQRSDLLRVLPFAVVFVLTPAVLVLIAVLLILNGFTMLRKEGRRLPNLLSFFAGVAILLGIASVVLVAVARAPSTAVMAVFWLAGILSVYFAATFLSLLIYSQLYLKLPKNCACDYIIVHGCGLSGGERVSPLLRGRVDKAAEIWRNLEPKPKLVLSGGRGPDEAVSEAQAMRDYLLAQGFPAEDLILEDKSATTYENLQNVQAMLDRNGEKHRYLFVTNNYHVFRTSLFARKLHMDAAGIGCRTAGYYWPSAFLREYVAVMVRYKWITAAVLLVWLALTVESLLPIG